MKILDIIIIGFYYLIDGTKLRSTTKNIYSFGAIDQSILHSWAIHSLNIEMLLGVYYARIYKSYFNFNLFLVLSSLLFLFIYLIYKKSGRLEKLKARNHSVKVKLLYILITLCYTGITVYLFVTGSLYQKF